MPSSFSQWLDTFVEEKGLDPEHVFVKEGPSGTNLIPLANVLAALKQANDDEQNAIKKNLIRLDYFNSDVLGYFDHLSGALVM
jgi:hypothetical protein